MIYGLGFIRLRVRVRVRVRNYGNFGGQDEIYYYGCFKDIVKLNCTMFSFAHKMQ
jgi:hypothetical protein